MRESRFATPALGNTVRPPPARPRTALELHSLAACATHAAASVLAARAQGLRLFVSRRRRRRRGARAGSGGRTSDGHSGQSISRLQRIKEKAEFPMLLPLRRLLGRIRKCWVTAHLGLSFGGSFLTWNAHTYFPTCKHVRALV